MTRPLLLLLNLPGSQTYLRDYYCSKVTQADYLLPPTDLIQQSGFLADRFDLWVLDAMAAHRPPADVLAEIAARQPAVIVFLAGAASWAEDRPFLDQLAARCPDTRLVGMGDVFLEAGAALLAEMPRIEALLLDFTVDDLARYLAGDRADLGHMIWRDGPAVRDRTAPSKPSNKPFVVPVPRHELFLGNDYRYPFVKRRKFAVVLTDYGCPFRCHFCVMSGLGYRQRAVDNVVAELDHVRQLGVRDLMFLDQTFGVNAARTCALLEALRPMGFRWNAFSRVDLLDEPQLDLMKAAGCHTLILGVESGNEALLKANRKDYTKDQIRKTFALCRRHRIRTVATFILGLPDETHETIAETFAFIDEIKPDFSSFNVAVPRQGTQLRQSAMELGLAAPGELAMDQSGTRIAMRTKALTQADINQYMKTAIRRFYFRPGYMMKQALAIRSWDEFTILARQGWGVISRYTRQQRR